MGTMPFSRRGNMSPIWWGKRDIPNSFVVNNKSRADVKITVVTLGTGDLPSIQRRTATAGSDVVQSGRPIFDHFFQHLWPYIGNNTSNVVFQMVKRLRLIRMDQ
ncbi:hypothetical protein TNCV_3111911 [Trichonephila clavipes]|nr:hypothetical protein TNCV_3111911 [Trichonephila clavipes]